MIKISLIIAVYKNIDFLRLVLDSVANQSYKNFEVIIAEDGNDDNMKNFIENYAKESLFNIRHVSQEDIGFRKTRVLNKAIKVSKGELLVFIDGDCILDKNFLLSYAKNIEEKTVLYGRRVFLDKQYTNLLLQQDFFKLSKIKILFSKSNRKIEGIYSLILNRFRRKFRGIKGCNMGFLKKDIVSINGFDNDYTFVGAGEDDDLIWRFQKLRYKFKSLKNLAIQYHLFHERPNREEGNYKSLNILKEKKERGIVKVVNGLNQV